MRILAIAGSLREGSHNMRLLHEARRLAPSGIEVVSWNGLRDIPPYDPGMDVDPAPPAVAGMRRAIAGSDAVLISTPEYNGSVSGVLKNALDWASRPWPGNPLRGKPVAVMAASEGSFGGVWAQADAKRVLGITGARVIEEGLALPYAQDAFDESGGLIEPVYRENVVATLTALADEVAKDQAARSAA
jgi:chromate reductase, NAD(P)H dehydrogenase (quinone)